MKTAFFGYLIETADILIANKEEKDLCDSRNTVLTSFPIKMDANFHVFSK